MPPYKKRKRPKPSTVAKKAARTEQEKQHWQLDENGKFTGRTEIQKAKHDAQISELYLKGWSMRAIAAEVNVSLALVSKTMAKIHEEWRNHAKLNFDTYALDALRKYDLIEKEAWEMHDRLKSYMSRKTRTETGTNAKGEFSKEIEIVEEQTVSSEWLRVAMDANEKRNKLLGLDAPIKVLHQHNHTILDPKDARAKLEQFTATFRARAELTEDAESLQDAGEAIAETVEEEVVEVEYQDAEK